MYWQFCHRAPQHYALFLFGSQGLFGPLGYDLPLPLGDHCDNTDLET